MTNQKNRFFTVVFSCCPGAGEMYFGLYQQGIGLMGLFFGTAALAMWTGWEELILIMCPIVWCYSFFHTHNLRRMTEEEFAEVEDRFFFEDYVEWGKDWKFTEKHRRFFAVILLLIGLSALWQEGIRLLGSIVYMPEIFWSLSRSVPQIAMAIVILYAALRMMRGPREEAESENIETILEEKTKEAETA